MTIVGIDFGTTNSAVTTPTGTDVTIVPNERGERLTPSVVAIDRKQAVVGATARNQSVQHPDRTVFSVKDYMGTNEEILVGEQPNASAFVPEELAGMILRKLRQDAESALDQSINRAVLTVPAYFNDRQRQATKHAGEIAGLSVERVLNEPTAACLAYGLRTGADRLILVYDLGGGTFDSSLIEMGDGVFEVIATNGDTSLGGDDWDARIVDWLEEPLREEYGCELTDPVSIERAFDASRTAKHELTSRKKTTIRLPFLELDTETVDIERTLTQSTFESITRDLTEETIQLCEQLLAESPYTKSSIDEVLLVGGSTRMKQVRSRVATAFDSEPSTQINPDEAVALGAGVQAAILDDTLPVPSEDTDSELDTISASSVGGDLELRNPDDIVVLTVTPQSVGTTVMTDLQTKATEYSVLIPRNTPVPAHETGLYTTVADNQRYVRIEVLQGDGPLAENELLDAFDLGPLPPRPAGDPDLAVEFTIDQDGLLQVRATDMDNEIESGVTIESVFGRTADEIQAMATNLPEVR